MWMVITSEYTDFTAFQKLFVKSSSDGNGQFREDGCLFSLCSDSLSPSFNNISLYETIQQNCLSPHFKNI